MFRCLINYKFRDYTYSAPFNMSKNAWNCLKEVSILSNTLSSNKSLLDTKENICWTQFLLLQCIIGWIINTTSSIHPSILYYSILDAKCWDFSNVDWYWKANKSNIHGPHIISSLMRTTLLSMPEHHGWLLRWFIIDDFDLTVFESNICQHRHADYQE